RARRPDDRCRTPVAPGRAAGRPRTRRHAGRGYRAVDRVMRRLISFPCEDATLVGTLDEGSSDTGLLIVSGGNEPRMGAHRGQAMLAARIAARGYSVFRFDRR